MTEEDLELILLEGLEAEIDGFVAEFFLDAEELVVLGHTIGSGSRAGLDLSGIDGNGEIRDGGILGFAGAMADHGGVAVGVGKADGVERPKRRCDERFRGKSRSSKSDVRREILEG